MAGRRSNSDEFHRRPAATARISARRRLADAAATAVVRGGGFAVLAAILGILVFLAAEAAPLLRRARVEPLPAIPHRGAPPAAALVDEHRTHAALLLADGRVVAVDLASGARRDVLTLPEAVEGPAVAEPRDDLLAAALPGGRVALLRVHFPVRFDGGRRITDVAADPPELVEILPGVRLRALSARLEADGNAVVVAATEGGRLLRVDRRVEENPFTGERREQLQRTELALPASGPVDALALDRRGAQLYAGTEAGRLLRWRFGDGPVPLGEPELHRVAAGPVTALLLLLGERSLVVGTAAGELSLWFPVRPSEEAVAELRRIREFPSLAVPVRLLLPSERDRSFLAVGADGGGALYYGTSGQQRARFPAGRSEVRAAAYAPKGDGAVLAAVDGLRPFAVDPGHPEATLRTLFTRVWYEGYPAPAHVWQSSSGGDVFEPKLGLMPLIVGTLKGTFYSLLLAIPVGLLAAIYASQFLHERLRGVLKPAVEIMASIPSVVLGFLAGLWLARRMADLLPGLLLFVVFVPAGALLASRIWWSLPRRITGSLPAGSELALHLATLAAALAAAVALAPAAGEVLFGGSFPGFVRNALGIPYEERNAVVVGVAMGFAVIPILFSVAEDALSNVPRSLAAASLALGATRWQTVVRVVLPSASPGIFSAVMIAVGRAVGETMIVLMAAGNTPLLDWNPFTGFRTLSANIAVEVPEAPAGSTLYRTLFLTALLLFAFTFLVNTAAEVVRHRLRARFARL